MPGRPFRRTIRVSTTTRGDADQTGTGGAPPTQPGYGPNIRTVMQFLVGDQTVATPAAGPPPGVPPNAYDAAALNALKAAWPTAYSACQPPRIVPEKAYGDATNTYSRIGDTSLTLGPSPLASFNITVPGSGYTAAPTVTIAAPSPPSPGAIRATAHATIAGGKVTAIVLDIAGAGYTSAPGVTIGAPTTPGGVRAIALAVTANSQPMLPKAIQELFELDYGRMNSTLGVELPFTNFKQSDDDPAGLHRSGHRVDQ